MLPNKVPFKSFKVMYKSALKTQHLNTAKVTRNAGFSSSYLYNVLHNYNDNKYISISLLKKIAKGLNYNQQKFSNWITNMTLLKTKSPHKNLIHDHPQSQHNHYENHYKRIKNYTNHNDYSDDDQHSYRYHLIGQVVGRLHHLDTHDLKVMRLIANKFYYADKNMKNERD